MSKPAIRCAIGDIHGRFDLLDPLLSHLEELGSRHGGAQIVLLGDYVDRGKMSRQVIERLVAGPVRPENEFVCLLGNHDLYMIAALRSPKGRPLAGWLEEGGVRTMVSYGLANEDHLFDGSVVDYVPEAHIRWLEGLRSYLETDLHVFVHAGLAPGIPLEDQDPDVMITIRDQFLESDEEFDKLVVHGHSIEADQPSIHRHRISLDTGAYKSSRLTAAIFAAGERLPVFIQAVEQDKVITIMETAALTKDTVQQAPVIPGSPQ